MIGEPSARGLYVERAWSVATLVAAAVILSGPAIYNRYPLLFPDTLGYLASRDALVDLVRPDNVRPVFYGWLLLPFRFDGGLWAVVLAQGMLVAYMLRRTLGVLSGSWGHLALLALAALLATVTSLPWYVSHILPDIFAGLLILALFLLGGSDRALGWKERLALTALATAGILVHLSHLAIAGAVFVVTVILRWLLPNVAQRISLRQVALPLGLAIAAMIGYAALANDGHLLPPHSPAFVLGRLFADGPGRAYLEGACVKQTYLLCQYQDRLSGTTDEIMWRPSSPLWRRDLYQRVKAEEPAIILGTVGTFPLWVAQRVVIDFLKQLMTAYTEIYFDEEGARQYFTQHPQMQQAFHSSRQGEGQLTTWSLRYISMLDGWVVLASVVACLAGAAVAVRQGDWLILHFMAVVAAGILANAFVCGVLSSGDGRYQARIVWLIPFAAIVGAARLIGTKRTVRP